MTRVLIIVICALAAATVGVGVAVFMGPVNGTIAGSLAFVLSLQIDTALVRRRDRRSFAKEIVRLKKDGEAFQIALVETQDKLDQVNAVVETRTTEQNKKIVSELKMLEGLMRDFATRIANKSREVTREEVPVVVRPAAGAASYFATLGEPELLELIRASLEENRVDLYLQPMVSLPQRKLRFYEALSRLRAQDGAVIMPAQYMKVAAPAGLMSVVDNLLLFRCVQIVRKLTQKSKDVGVFCNISGDTLKDTEFFPQFLDYMQNHRDLARNIVFEFAQDAVLNASVQVESNLRYLASLGFSLSMDHVETLALDFNKLNNLGFRHLKVRADILTNGMAGARAAVAAEDFRSLLQRFGLDLIAERVEDEKTVIQLLDYGVDFAQGFLFGEPRAVRDDSLKAMEKDHALASVIPFKRAG
jgi:cyclic-di-GMP phosphodiesterase TipF (flagellum assembly factor)